jgi:hypothetical protein
MSIKKVFEFETTISKIIKKNEELAKFKVNVNDNKLDIPLNHNSNLKEEE